MVTTLFPDPLFSTEIIKEFLPENIEEKLVPKKSKFHINVYGYGKLGEELVDQIAFNIAAKDSNIDELTVWFRPGVNKNLNKVKSEFYSRIFTYNKNELLQKVNFQEIRSLKEAGEKIVKASENNKREGIEDLTILMTRYSGIDNKLFYKKGNDLHLYTKSSLQSKFGSEDEMKKFLETLIYEPSQQHLAEILKLQEQRSVLETVIDELKYPPHNIDKEYMFRIKMLKSNLLGVSEFGKAIKGYKGSLLNFVNDVELTNIPIIENSDIPYNRVWSPIDNDWIRAISETAVELHNMKIAGEINEDIDIKEILIDKTSSGHGSGFDLDSTNITIKGTPWSEYIEIDRENHLRNIAQNVKKAGRIQAQRDGRPSRDNITAIMLQLKSILNNQFDITHRCIGYSPDYNITLGQATKIQNNKMVLSGNLEEDISKMSSNSQEKIMDYINTNLKVSEALKKAGFLKGTKPKYEDPGKPELVKTSLLDNTWKLIKNALSKKKKHLLHYVLEPRMKRSLLRYDINSENTIKTEIQFPETTRLASISMLSSFSDGVVALMERELKNKLSYTIYSVSKDGQHPVKVNEFVSGKILAAQHHKSNFFFLEEFKNNRKLWSLDIINSKETIYENVPSDLKLITALNNKLYGITNKKILAWSGSSSIPESLLEGNLGFYLNGFVYNGQTILSIKESGKAAIYNVNTEEIQKFDAITGKVGVKTTEKGIEALFVNPNHIVEYRKGYNVTDLKSPQEQLYLSNRSLNIIDNMVSQIKITNNFAIVGGKKGQLFFEINPLKYEGRYIDKATRIFTDSERQ